MAKVTGPDGISGDVVFHREGPSALALADGLRKADLEGEVRFDQGSRALYATDYSIYRQVPIGVVIPKSTEDVVNAVDVCRQHGAPILGRGCGTSPNGQCCNVAVVLDFSKYMNEILELDPEEQTAWVQPGVVCDQLRDAAEEHGLTFGPDPATHAYCTLGGMIGNNSCGTHSVMAGQTVVNIEELDILLYDGTRMRVGNHTEEEANQIISKGGRKGEVYGELEELRDRYADLVRERYPNIPRRCSGYNLDQLLPESGFNVARALVGTESTCVFVLNAKVRLIPSPPHRKTVVVGYPDRFVAGDQAPAVMEQGPIGLEGFDTTLTANMAAMGKLVTERQQLPDGEAWLLIEFGADSEKEVQDKTRGAIEKLQESGLPRSVEPCNPERQQAVWAVRQAGVDYSHMPGEFETYGGWEDAAVSPYRLGDYLRDFASLHRRYGYGCVYYGHFGQGCIHTRLDFDLKTADGIQKFRSFLEDAADLVASYGGSIAGEYGEGQRAELLPKMFGEDLVEGFRKFKYIWDPAGKMNPGKVVDPYPLDANLRLGAGYNPPKPKTHFKFPDDHGSFAMAAERCFGVGRCRKQGGTMCPSYQATREENHTTRGRANMLFEMLQQEVVTEGWRDENVKESLDLCLACKGCKGECPVNVDMATYKAEFLSHYYKRRLRPMSAYALGLIHWWSRLASLSPGLVNFFTGTPLLSDAVKAGAGVASQRQLPSFAAPTFKERVRKRSPANPGGSPVILWPDTFHNHFRPEVAEAAVEVLEDAGYRVEVPETPFCCGRPLYDYGMLSLAKHQLRRVLRALGPRIRAGVSVIGLEPSCVAVFRDELTNLFPHDEDAKRLKTQTFLLSEFLDKHGYDPPKLARKAIVHGHCHHKSIMGLDADEAMLEKLGLDFEVLDSGCCGLAGSWGYEQDHYRISMKAGERVLLPAVRDAAKDTLIVTDGFSCRSQIEEATERRALHLAQVLQMALHREAIPIIHPESHFLENKPGHPEMQATALMGTVLLGAGVGVLAWRHASRTAR